MENVRYPLSAMVLCGGFRRKYDLETYIHLIEVLNPVATESEVKVILRPHGPPGRSSPKIENIFELCQAQLYYLKGVNANEGQGDEMVCV